MAHLGIYEKALPKNVSWKDRLLLAKKLGFNFVEMSVDETDERLARLDWTKQERKELIDAEYEVGFKVYSMCLSGHRRFPFGSSDPDTRSHGLQIMKKAIDLASDLGIRNIQLAGYDVYYEPKTLTSRAYFMENLQKAVAMAAEKQVMLSIEIMDDPFINSVTKFNKIKKQIHSPWLQVYPDLGNLNAWPENDVEAELELGIDEIAALHVKDTLNVTDTFKGKFKNVPFGEGQVDFLGCFKTLKRLGYNGTFMLEMWSETSDDPEAEIKKALAYTLPIFKEAGYEF